MMTLLTSGCSQMMGSDNKSIPCSVTKLIQVSLDDTRETKTDVIIYNQQPFRLYCTEDNKWKLL